MNLLYSTLLCIVFTFPKTNDLQQYWVEFSDKSNSPYSIERPEDFLSQRAIARRTKQKIPIKESDLPVNPFYLKSLKNRGAIIHFSSKWFNASKVICDEQTANEIRKLPFVKNMEYAGKYFQNEITLEHRKPSKNRLKRVFQNHYGFAKEQIEMLNGHKLHNMGYFGEGMIIVVLDAGFYNVDKSPFFNDLRNNGKLLGCIDFVNLKNVPFQSSMHGTKVLSVMAANVPGLMVGTAPKASYCCIKTEDSRGEFRFEECNWLAGLEYADSIGADVINSSLGYTIFNDTTMNYSHEDLDGRTALCTQAAEMAFQKGMIIVNSAGNEGTNNWEKVACPADAKNVLTVGSCNYYGKKTNFSSFGTTKDGRLKPDIVTLGEDIAVASVVNSDVLSAEGTSYSSAIICGLIATLWQAFPNKTNLEIIDALKSTASHSKSANPKIGYGVPDFTKAYFYLKSSENN